MNKQERDSTIMSYSKLVHYKARTIVKVPNRQLYENLYQEGMLAVCKAVDAYVENATYSMLQSVSFAVSSSMCKYVGKYNLLIPIKHGSDKNNAAYSLLRKQLGNDLSHADIVKLSKEADVDVKVLTDMYNTATAGFEDLYEGIPDVGNTTIDNYYSNKFLFQLLKQAIPRLSDEEKKAIYYMLQDKSMAELAKERGVSKQASQEALRKGIKKLSTLAKSKNIQFCDVI